MRITRYLLSIFLFYVGSFAFSQTVALMTEYYKAVVVLENAVEGAELCRSSKNMKIFPHQCSEYIYTVENMVPVLAALKAISETTYSCGFISCKYLILELLNSWPGIIFVVVLAAFVFLYLFGWIERLSEGKPVRRKQQVEYPLTPPPIAYYTQAPTPAFQLPTTILTNDMTRGSNIYSNYEQLRYRSQQ